MKNLDFKIEKSTMRELTHFETQEVGGGPVTTASGQFCVGVTIRIIREVTTWFTGDGDTIHENGFEP